MAMSKAEIDAFLNGVHLARVATVRPDGRPHVAPVWYLWEDGCFYFETSHSAVKANNLRSNPNIAITVDISEGGLRLRYVILEGQATLIENKGTVKRLTERIYSRYVGVEALQTPTLIEMLEVDNLIVRLKPTKFITMDQLNPTELSAL
jgi:PPOX class probable F420-dependent enzyme